MKETQLPDDSGGGQWESSRSRRYRWFPEEKQTQLNTHLLNPDAKREFASVAPLVSITSYLSYSASRCAALVQRTLPRYASPPPHSDATSYHGLSGQRRRLPDICGDLDHLRLNFMRLPSERSGTAAVPNFSQGEGTLARALDASRLMAISNDSPRSIARQGRTGLPPTRIAAPGSGSIAPLSMQGTIQQQCPHPPRTRRPAPALPT